VLDANSKKWHVYSGKDGVCPTTPVYYPRTGALFTPRKPLCVWADCLWTTIVDVNGDARRIRLEPEHDCQ
jgi:hypothetical protein